MARGSGVGFFRAKGVRRSAEPKAAVDVENLSGDEAGAGGKEQDGFGYIGGGAVAPHGRFRGKALGIGSGSSNFIRNISIRKIIDEARSDAVDADLRGEGLGHGAREHVEGGFGGAVVRVAGPGVGRAKRADVDDAAVGGAQVGQGLAGSEEGASGVGFKDCIPLSKGHLLEGDGLEDGCVVNKDIEAGEAGDGGGDGGTD